MCYLIFVAVKGYMEVGDSVSRFEAAKHAGVVD
jgi:hypothetical protein